MCGRFAIAITLKEAEKEFGIKKIYNTFTPSYNIAPSQGIPVIWNEDGMITLDVYKWGLIPHWAKEPNMSYKMINARIETIAEKHTYNKELLEGRCIIPASGFFEWKKAKDKKSPHFIHLKDKKVMSFAGLSSQWKAPDGTILKTCSIITTNANTFMKSIHDRMPAILTKELEKDWLNTKLKDKSEIVELIKQYPSKEMEAYEVSSLVNSPAHNSPDCIAPL